MNFYGVGVKWDRTNDKLPDYLTYGFWCMGYWSNERPVYDELIQSIRTGDVVFAKSYVPEQHDKLYIRAIGFVSDKEIPNKLPEEYSGKCGFSVNWTTLFEPHIILEPTPDFMPNGFMKEVGNLRTRTIFRETNDTMLLKIIKLMNGPY